jgi:hypothetical protein
MNASSPIIRPAKIRAGEGAVCTVMFDAKAAMYAATSAHFHPFASR